MYKLSCKMLRILRKNSFQNWSELLAIFTLGRFGIGNYYEAPRVDACSVEKSSTSYLQRLFCCPCAVQECLFILGSTDFWCSFGHEE
jgi:hypothetical protein